VPACIKELGPKLADPRMPACEFVQRGDWLERVGRCSLPPVSTVEVALKWWAQIPGIFRPYGLPRLLWGANFSFCIHCLLLDTTVVVESPNSSRVRGCSPSSQRNMATDKSPIDPRIAHVSQGRQGIQPSLDWLNFVKAAGWAKTTGWADSGLAKLNHFTRIGGAGLPGGFRVSRGGASFGTSRTSS
jgi:hypothetical protein